MSINPAWAQEQVEEKGASGVPQSTSGSVSLDGTPASRAAYEKGVAMAVEKRFVDAQREFAEAVSENPPLEAYFGLGQVELALGHPCAAVEAYSKYLEVGGTRIFSTKRRAVQTHIEQLRLAGASDAVCHPLPEQTLLSIHCAEAGVDAAVDGERAQVNSPVPLNVSPGTHQITLFKDSREVSVANVLIAEGERSHFWCAALPLPRSLDESSQGTFEDSRLSTTQRIGLTVGAGGVGVALAALGHFLWNRGRYAGYQAQGSELSERSPPDRVSSYNELGSSITRAGRVSLGLALAGAATTSVGLTLFLLGGEHHDGEHEVALGSGAQRLTLAPQEGSMALQWRGRW